MSSDIAIRVTNLSKCYQIYENPRDRLKQFVLPRFKRALGRESSNYYREFWALRDVSFEVRRGETYGIIGRNGSGKSTLLQMICGTLTPTSGSVETRGRIAALLELGAGFNPEFTGRENVYLNASVLGLSREEVDKKFAAIEDFADIGDFIDQPIKTYSSGMYVRLAFAVIAHVDADILVIDEALAVGDAFFTQKCMRFLRKFMKTKTILFVSHDTGSVKNLCNKVLWLNRGVLMDAGSPKEVCEKYFEAIYAEQQGNGAVREKNKKVAARPVWNKDCRSDMLNASNMRNDIQIFAFRPEESAGFGAEGAEIQDVALYGADGERVLYVVGGESVVLEISILALRELHQPIVGFSFKDHLGQVLFGDNTYLSYNGEEIVFTEGSLLKASFSFIMPILPSGDYSIATAIATGTQLDHVQHHWIHDALILKSLSSSVSTGLVGIPMHEIRICIEG